jgi:ectoine hydroxylase-related dioxygenase (phytanoyl-CoA dioxygenase family)
VLCCVAGYPPTIFLPKTHTAAAHAEYADILQCDTMLSERPSVVALLNSGDAVLYDSRTMHCGGANDIHEGATRALLYFSFLNPRAILPMGDVGSIMSDFA